MLYHPQSAIRNPQSAKRKILIGAECKRNRRFFGTTSEARSSKSFEKITEGKTILPTVGTPNKKRYPCIIGFTLIEMMVVIGLIAVVGAWAIPGLKKAYDSFKFAETFDHLDTFRSSFTAFYLIKNEFPGDCTKSHINEAEAWCLPGSYYKRVLENKKYELNVIPYQATAYDIDNWINTNLSISTEEFRQFHITISVTGLANIRKWIQRLQNRYGNTSVLPGPKQDTAALAFPGMQDLQAEESPVHRDRFY